MWITYLRKINGKIEEYDYLTGKIWSNCTIEIRITTKPYIFPKSIKIKEHI